MVVLLITSESGQEMSQQEQTSQVTGQKFQTEQQQLLQKLLEYLWNQQPIITMGRWILLSPQFVRKHLL